MDQIVITGTKKRPIKPMQYSDKQTITITSPQAALVINEDGTLDLYFADQKPQDQAFATTMKAGACATMLCNAEMRDATFQLMERLNEQRLRKQAERT
jgi:hypothetical protein